MTCVTFFTLDRSRVYQVYVATKVLYLNSRVSFGSERSSILLFVKFKMSIFGGQLFNWHIEHALDRVRVPLIT
jgi:hypothetical protein